jgi:predicted amidohydrolase YtcJ
MIHVNGDELFDLALKVFEEVKNMKLNENLL